MKGSVARFLTGGITWVEFKDILVARICNFLLTRVASPQFSGKLTLVIEHGMAEAEAGNVPGLQKRTS